MQAICSFSLCIYVAENFHFLLNKSPHKFKLFFSASQNLFVISVSATQLGCDMANYYYHGSSSSSSPPLPLHLCFFLGIMFVLLGFSWYVNYESTVESVVDQIKMYLMLSPLVLLLAVHWLQSSDDRRVAFLFPAPERDSFHRAGSSPWGVALLLVLLMFMISYQSSFQERWFPLLSR